MAKLVSSVSGLVSYQVGSLLPQNPDTSSNLISVTKMKRTMKPNAGGDKQRSQECPNYPEPGALTRVDVPKHPDARRPTRRSSSCPTSGGVINSGDAESKPSVTAMKAPSSNYQFSVPMSQGSQVEDGKMRATGPIKVQWCQKSRVYQH
ncbi:hypothetical protein BJ912DRAFT_932557 [Pholiota molesta]|nr:hypothetical protein BJ912DRAFT_932557 [Pholiota molesta]